MAPPSSGGASVLATFSGSRAADPGRLYSTQCTQVPAGASGSSAMRAKAAVPAGAPLQASDGETSTPSQVCFTGIAVPCRNAVLVSENAMRSSPSRTVAAVTFSAMNSSIPRTRPRGLFVAVLLLLTLALAGIIAFEAHRTFLGHRATAERILQDYARLAAARFAQRTAMNLYYHAFSPAIEAMARAKAGTPGAPLPTPRQLAAGLDQHAADFLKATRYAL